MFSDDTIHELRRENHKLWKVVEAAKLVNANYYQDARSQATLSMLKEALKELDSVTNPEGGEE